MDALLAWWTQNPLTNGFFSPDIIASALPVVARAFPISLGLVAVAFLVAIPIGLVLAFMKMARTRWTRWPATVYIDIVRGTPMFLQILIVFFGLPLLPFYRTIVTAYPWMNEAGPFNITYTYWFRGLFVLCFNSSAYMAEIFRAGIQSISRGQMEAARSLGMTATKAMAFIIIPQTVRRILPTMMSEFILLFKDTALLGAVGFAEMVLRAREVAATRANLSPYMVAAAFYLMVTIPLGRVVARMESRLAASEGGTGAVAPESKSPADVPLIERRDVR